MPAFEVITQLLIEHTGSHLEQPMCTGRDRQAIEALISEDFHFTSPLDNRIDRIRSRLNTLKEDK